jgi:DNA-binding beta-propeller fold protein YncE
VAVDSTYVYVADSENNRIQKFTKAGVFQGWWGKDSVVGKGWHAPGTALNPTYGSGTGEFYWPIGITVDAAGNVYVTEQLNGRIQKFTAGGAYVSTINWAGMKVSWDQESHLYAVHGIGFAMFDPSGTYQGQFGVGGTGNGQFASASGVCVIPNWTPALANVYVADTNNDRIQVMWRRDDWW